MKTKKTSKKKNMSVGIRKTKERLQGRISTKPRSCSETFTLNPIKIWALAAALFYSSYHVVYAVSIFLFWFKPITGASWISASGFWFLSTFSLKNFRIRKRLVNDMHNFHVLYNTPSEVWLWYRYKCSRWLPTASDSFWSKSYTSFTNTPSNA